MRKIFLYILLAIFMVGCEKDNFESKPSLKINSISANKIFAGEDLQIKLQLSDLEGDFLDTIWIKKSTTTCTRSNFTDSSLFQIPSDLPRTKNFSAELILTLNYSVVLQPRCFSSDTTTFSFWVKDEKGNKSDTVKTSPIIISR
ncbi:MAG: hypothetical protein ACO3AW_07105 [Chitinophagaceae bacterium]